MPLSTATHKFVPSSLTPEDLLKPSSWAILGRKMALGGLREHKKLRKTPLPCFAGAKEL
jgi:hypothetical protein